MRGRFFAVFALSSCFFACAHARPPAAAALPFDTSAVDEILAWSKTSTTPPPSAWRDARAYVLTREWARWSGLPDPDRDIEVVLGQIEVQKLQQPGSAPLQRVEDLLDALEARRGQFVTDAARDVGAYLPEGTPVGGRVLFAIFIPPYAFAWGDGTIVINLTASYWAFEPDKILHLIAHELFHNGFGKYQAASPAALVDTPESLLAHILWQTQNEGMATYVGYRSRPPDLFVEDYALIEDTVTLGVLFQKLRGLIDDARAAAVTSGVDLGPLKKRTFTLGSEDRVFFVVGAAMAQRIETISGRKALVETIRGGPRAFFRAYSATNPGAGNRLPEL